MNVDIVQRFLTGIGADLEGARKTYLDLLAEDFVWESCGVPVCEGREAALSLLDDYHRMFGFERMEVEFCHVVADGEIVMVEHRERHFAVDGSIIGGDWINAMGVFEVRDGRIAARRDYFDNRPS